MKLNGLVLAGGKSVRMKQDKSMVLWYDKPQRYYLANLLGNFCDQVFISCRTVQKDEIDHRYQPLVDIYDNIGPFGGVLSALDYDHDCGWVVVACDLPLLDSSSIAYLISQRDTALMATAYENPADGLPEPMVVIWEPAAYPLLLSFLQEGGSSLRKILVSNQIKLVKPLNPEILTNVNTPEEAMKVRSLLAKD